MAYSLTLTKSERDAIDWVGYRYRHGDELYKLLCECQWTPDDLDWDSELDITFSIPEHIAWTIGEIIDDGLDCFADEFCIKLHQFRNRIV